MFLVDVNVLLQAAIRSAPSHEKSRSWLDERLNGPQLSVGLPWHSLLGFVRIASGPRFVDPPISVAQAWRQVERWMDAPASWVPVPGHGHRHILTQFVATANPTHGLVSDLHLAALAVENGLAVVSTDAGFGRIPGVRWMNPLNGS
jgi:toxin-antitoxin system PIN domain toxin